MNQFPATLRKSGRYLSVFTMLVCLFVCSSSRAEIYTVYGHIRYEALGLTNVFREFDFTVAVSNCIWAIELAQTADSQAGIDREPIKHKLPNGEVRIIPVLPSSDAPQRFRQTFNGVELAFISYWPHTLYVTNAGKVEESAGILLLENNDVPDAHDGGVAATLWFAYASRCYLDQTSGDRLKPLLFLETNMRLNGFTTPAKLDRHDGGKGLPVDAAYYFDEAAWNALASFKTPPRSKSRGGDSEEDPLLWAKYAAGDFTNAFGIAIPSAFVHTGFEPFHELVKSGDRLAVVKITGVTRDITDTLDKRLFDPQFKGSFTVEDFRLPNREKSSGITYTLTDSAPQPVDSRELVSLRARDDLLESRSRSSAPPSGTGHRFLVVLTLCVITGGFVWLVARQRKTKS